MELETEIVDKTRDAIELWSQQQGVLNELRSYREGLQMMRKKLPCIRHIDKKKIMIKVKKINDVITYLPIDNITELNDTCYACAATVTKKLVKNRLEIAIAMAWIHYRKAYDLVPHS